MWVMLLETPLLNLILKMSVAQWKILNLAQLSMIMQALELRLLRMLTKS